VVASMEQMRQRSALEKLETTIVKAHASIDAVLRRDMLWRHV
jgi:hypothetical protein